MQKKEAKYLKEWMLRYIKNKDIIAKRIHNIDENEFDFLIKKSGSESRFFVFPFLNELDGILKELKEYSGSKALVCFHTKDNYDKLIANWEKFVDIGRELTIYFINPFSKTDKVLIISPYIHDLVSDNETLELGLKTMSGNVEFITEEEIRKIINS